MTSPTHAAAGSRATVSVVHTVSGAVGGLGTAADDTDAIPSGLSRLRWATLGGNYDESVAARRPTPDDRSSDRSDDAARADDETTRTRIGSRIELTHDTNDETRDNQRQ
jgi:hypothetical protein